ncbi:MAG: CDP-glycerol glycerophosphotransferase family protein [Parcubacteria group bacterium]|jgi:hypothetical protein
MNKIIITAPFGSTFKNLFLNVIFLELLLKKYNEIHIFTPIPLKDVKKIFNYEQYPSISLHFIPEKFKFFQMVFSQATIISFNKYINSSTFDVKTKDQSLIFSQRLILGLCLFLRFFLSWKKQYLFFDYFKFLFSKDEKTKLLISKIKPDVIFVTAPSFRFDFSVIKEALDRCIPIVGMVHSWDNLSSKGPININFEKILIWNKFQEEEILSFFSDYKGSVHKVGIPQLDFYLKNKNLLSKENLCEYLGITNDRKIITYTTGTHPMIPNENIIIEKIIKEFEKSIVFKWFLLVRLHPRDDIKYYKNLKKYNNVKIETTNSKNIQLNDGMGFQMEDLVHYGNILKNSDVILNVVSTVLLEALVMRTPAIGIAFDEDKLDFYSSVKRFYKFNHAEYLLRRDGSHIAHSLSDLVKKINFCINHKYVKTDTAKELAHSLRGNSGEKIANILCEYCK